MAESTRNFTIFEQPGREHQALPAKPFDVEAFLIAGVWAVRNRLWLNAVALLVLEILCLAAIIWWGLVFVIPLFIIHAYCGLGAYSMLSRDMKNQGYASLGEVRADSDITAISGVKSGQLQPVTEAVSLEIVPSFFKPISAVAYLTWKAAFRYKFFWLMSVMLLIAVVALPLILQDDGSPKSLIHILITYTLAMITTLLGVSTLWLACGTLARDVEECQMQMVATKPIPRWQIWLGKWLGVMSLNAALLALAGASVYGMLHYRLDQFAEKRFEALQHEPQNRVNGLAWMAGMRTNRTSSLPEWAAQDVRDLTVELEEPEPERRKKLDEWAQSDPRLIAQQFWHAYLPKYMEKNLPAGFGDKLRRLVARLEVDKARRKYLVGRASVQPILDGYEKRAAGIARQRLYERINEEYPEVLKKLEQKVGRMQAENPEFKPMENQAVLFELLQDFLPASANLQEWDDQSLKEAKAWMESVPVRVPDGQGRAMFRGTEWKFNLPVARRLPDDTSITLRFKLEVFANTFRENLKDTVNINLKDRVFPVVIKIGDLQGSHQIIQEDMTIRTFHEFDIYPGDFSEDGDLTFVIMNYSGQPTWQSSRSPEPVFSPPVSLSVPFWNGEMELLYEESSFAMNFIRGLMVLYCWLGLLAALGLAAASFMAFPMAAFTSVGVLIIAFSTPLMREVIEDDTIIQGYTQTEEGSFKDTSFLDWYAVPMFKIANAIISPLTDYSPVSDLSEGRSITWKSLFWAYFWVWGVGAGIFVLGGIIIFQYRELAITEGN